MVTHSGPSGQVAVEVAKNPDERKKSASEQSFY